MPARHCNGKGKTATRQKYFHFGILAVDYAMSGGHTVGNKESTMQAYPGGGTTSPPQSWVRPCRECGGDGEVWNGKGRGGSDPDSWLVECEACEGVGIFECEVCGHDQLHDGYDCFVCEEAMHNTPGGHPITPEVLDRYRRLARTMTEGE
jgi:hypothetical protein